MNFDQIQHLLIAHFGETIILKAEPQLAQPCLTIEGQKLVEICQFLHENEKTYFDTLSCLTAIDNGPEAGTMEVLYHLYSIPYHHFLVLKVIVLRNKEGEPLPKVPSVCSIWCTANWHEREAFDLLGIEFEGHPDLRRILLPADWQGFPLRKDYQQQDRYHGIKVEY
jgi:NADH-quinone oxidoreductase subunit C